MKKLTIIPLLVGLTLVSCSDWTAKSEYDKRYWELKKKTIELEYLEKLYNVRQDVESKEKLRQLDSLIIDFRKNNY